MVLWQSLRKTFNFFLFQSNFYHRKVDFFLGGRGGITIHIWIDQYLLYINRIRRRFSSPQLKLLWGSVTIYGSRVGRILWINGQNLHTQICTPKSNVITWMYTHNANPAQFFLLLRGTPPPLPFLHHCVKNDFILVAPFFPDNNLGKQPPLPSLPSFYYSGTRRCDNGIVSRV